MVPLAATYAVNLQPPQTQQQTLAAVSLRAAGNYVILAKTAINNVPTSAITGNRVKSPATSL
jgi:hypothetical protein